MYWEKIQGWGSFNNLFQEIVTKFNDGAIFVELGVWKGQSAVCMAENIKKSNKRIKFYAIDPFTGEGEAYQGYKAVIEKTLFDEYMKNIKPLKSYIKTLVGFSYEHYTKFKDRSIDFLFIDADHGYEAVKQDLTQWFPKIKIGGVIAGDDYMNKGLGVNKAVNDFFKYKQIPIIKPLKNVHGGCFYFEK